MMDDNDFRELLKYFNRPWQGYRKVRKGVIKRLRRHMTELDCTNLGDYIAVLEQNQAAYQMCQAYLRVTISRFCRDKQVWRHLENRLLPELAAHYPSELKVWSAGCACGEEPYSLAILWDRLQIPTALKITATDADPLNLERARKGVFGKSSLKALSPECISSCFRRLNAKHYSILPHLQENISWYVHDLLDTPPQRQFHLIFLRNNLLTYYQQPTLGPAAERIVETLMSGGLLVIGAHERLPDLSVPLFPDNLCPLIFHRPYS
jgi:chemotaxis protein methyltransferase CheR